MAARPMVSGGRFRRSTGRSAGPLQPPGRPPSGASPHRGGLGEAARGAQAVLPGVKGHLLQLVGGGEQDAAQHAAAVGEADDAVLTYKNHIHKRTGTTSLLLNYKIE